MKTHILPLLILWALFGAIGIANAQLEAKGPPPDGVQPQPPLTNTNDNGGALTPAAPCGGCGNGACDGGPCHGCCFQRFMAWLCYKPLPVPQCACPRTCNYEYYPRMNTYFQPATSFTGGSSDYSGCQNCRGNR